MNSTGAKSSTNISACGWGVIDWILSSTNVNRCLGAEGNLKLSSVVLRGLLLATSKLLSKFTPALPIVTRNRCLKTELRVASTLSWFDGDYLFYLPSAKHLCLIYSFFLILVAKILWASFDSPHFLQVPCLFIGQDITAMSCTSPFAPLVLSVWPTDFVLAWN